MAGPLDSIRPKWDRVTRRLQAEACRQGGYAVLQISVLVGPDGDPCLWMEPELRRIEPKHGIDNVIAMLLALDKQT